MIEAATVDEATAFTDYEPNDPQSVFHAARATHKRRWFVAGIQSGKTEAGAFEAALFAMRERPGGRGAVFGPDYPKAIEARDRFNAMVPYEQRTWNGSERTWKIRAAEGTESTVYWRSMHDADAPRGLVLDWMWLDECAMYSEEGWNNLRPRVAVKEGHIWGTSTPRGRNWLWKQSQQRSEDEDLLIHCQSIDNPAFPMREWDALKKRHGADSPFFKQEYMGLFQAFVGQAIPAFDRTRHVRPIALNPDANHVRGWDFGWTAPTVALWCQIDPDEHVTIKGCKLWTETERPLILAQARFAAMNGFQPAAEYIDPSGLKGRAREAGDYGWRLDMESKGWSVKYTRQVSETRRLNLIRQWVHQGKFSIDPEGETQSW